MVITLKQWIDRRAGGGPAWAPGTLSLPSSSSSSALGSASSSSRAALAAGAGVGGAQLAEAGAVAQAMGPIERDPLRLFDVYHSHTK